MAKTKETPMTKAEQFAQAVRIKKAVLDVVSSLMETLDNEMKSTVNEYTVMGKEDEQATDWKTGELLWEDDEKTIPRYRDKWGYVEIPEENMTPEAKAKIEAINILAEALTKIS